MASSSTAPTTALTTSTTIDTAHSQSTANSDEWLLTARANLRPRDTISSLSTAQRMAGAELLNLKDGLAMMRDHLSTISANPSTSTIASQAPDGPDLSSANASAPLAEASKTAMPSRNITPTTNSTIPSERTHITYFQDLARIIRDQQECIKILRLDQQKCMSDVSATQRELRGYKSTLTVNQDFAFEKIMKLEQDVAAIQAFQHSSSLAPSKPSIGIQNMDNFDPSFKTQAYATLEETRKTVTTILTGATTTIAETNKKAMAFLNQASTATAGMRKTLMTILTKASPAAPEKMKTATTLLTDVLPYIRLLTIVCCLYAGLYASKALIRNMPSPGQDYYFPEPEMFAQEADVVLNTLRVFKAVGYLLGVGIARCFFLRG